MYKFTLPTYCWFSRDYHTFLRVLRNTRSRPRGVSGLYPGSRWCIYSLASFCSEKTTVGCLAVDRMRGDQAMDRQPAKTAEIAIHSV